jgi:hypothetical protein
VERKNLTPRNWKKGWQNCFGRDINKKINLVPARPKICTQLPVQTGAEDTSKGGGRRQTERIQDTTGEWGEAGQENGDWRSEDVSNVKNLIK